MPLPVPHGLGAGGLAEGQDGDAAGLVAVGHAAVTLAPGSFLSIGEEVVAREVVMVPGLGAAEAAEMLLSHVGASASLAVGFGVVDALHLEMGVEASQPEPHRR